MQRSSHSLPVLPSCSCYRRLLAPGCRLLQAAPGCSRLFQAAAAAAAAGTGGWGWGGHLLERQQRGDQRFRSRVPNTRNARLTAVRSGGRTLLCRLGRLGTGGCGSGTWAAGRPSASETSHRPGRSAIAGRTPRQTDQRQMRGLSRVHRCADAPTWWMDVLTLRWAGVTSELSSASTICKERD